MQRSCHGVVMARPPTLGTYHREEQGRGVGRTGFIDQCLHTLTARPAVCTPKVLASLRLPQRHRVLAQAPSMPLPDLRKKRGNGIWQGEAVVSREVRGACPVVPLRNGMLHTVLRSKHHFHLLLPTPTEVKEGKKGGEGSENEILHGNGRSNKRWCCESWLF